MACKVDTERKACCKGSLFVRVVLALPRACSTLMASVLPGQ